MKSLIYFFLQILLIFQTEAWRVFYRGKRFGGNLGQPDAKVLKASEVEEQWFTQVLDHYDTSDTRTWQQRYFVNDKFYKLKKGPTFLMIGGEGGEMDRIFMTNGAWITYAKQFGALCILLEHRFYGKSRPTKDLSVENLQYLTTEQALADTATFIEAMKDKYKLPDETKWIVFGGSYAGSLAAWMRLKYPHLVHGVVSSSGPLLAKVDFRDYFKEVGESLSTFNDDCVIAIKEGFAQIDILLRNVTGQRSLDKKFKLCDPIEEANPNDVSNLYNTLASHFASAVQYDYEYGSINRTCKNMTNEQLGSPIDRLAAMMRESLDDWHDPCLHYKYNERINFFKNISNMGTCIGFRQWAFQKCNEFGFFHTSSYSPHIFSNTFPVQFFIQQCVDIFGPKYNSNFIYSGANRTNIFYGGLDIEVTKVVFVQGSVDPWHTLGIIKTRNVEAPAIYIKGTSHCADMGNETPKDPPQLKAARKQIKEYIAKWIRQ